MVRNGFEMIPHVNLPSILRLPSSSTASFGCSNLTSKSFVSIQNHSSSFASLPVMISCSISEKRSPIASSLLHPQENGFGGLMPRRNFKVVGKPQRRCQHCYLEVIDRRLYVFCEKHPRHKQMAMKKKEKKFWILTHATQSPKRPW